MGAAAFMICCPLLERALVSGVAGVAGVERDLRSLRSDDRKFSRRHPMTEIHPPTQSSDAKANQWAMFVHFSVLCGYLVPLAGLVAPIVLWQIKKDEYPIVDVHGKIVANWLISVFLYSLVCAVLTVVLIGTLGFLILGVLSVVFPIIGGIKANHGEAWPYPLSLKLIS